MGIDIFGVEDITSIQYQVQGLPKDSDVARMGELYGTGGRLPSYTLGEGSI